MPVIFSNSTNSNLNSDFDPNIVYEKSYKYIQSLKKSISGNSVSVDFDSLDPETAGMLKDAMYSVLDKRSHHLLSIFGSNTNHPC